MSLFLLLLKRMEELFVNNITFIFVLFLRLIVSDTLIFMFDCIDNKKTFIFKVVSYLI